MTSYPPKKKKTKKKKEKEGPCKTANTDAEVSISFADNTTHIFGLLV